METAPRQKKQNNISNTLDRRFKEICRKLDKKKSLRKDGMSRNGGDLCPVVDTKELNCDEDDDEPKCELGM